MYDKLGRLNQAEQAYKKLNGCKERSITASALIRLASVYQKKRDRPAAEKAFEEAIRVKPLNRLLGRASAYLNW